MTKTVVVIRPNAYKQKMYIYKDGNKIEEHEFFLKDFDDVINTKITKFDITQADFVGPKNFIRGLIKNIKESKPMVNFNLL